jgi:pilus assembly protein TadC
MSGFAVLVLVVACLAKGVQSLRSGRSVAAAPATAAVRGRALVTIGNLLPARARGWSPPWVAGGDVIARGAAATGLAASDVGAFRVGAATAFGGVAVLAGIVIEGGVGALVAVSLAGFGLAYPDLWLRAAAARRRELIERRAPLVLDLVAATVAAGIDLDAALRGATQASRGPLREELELVQANIGFGRPRRDELRDAAARADSPSLAALAMAVSLSDRLGVPLAETLESQARRTRADRGRAVQERAAAAGPRVLVVVVFVLVPAALTPLLVAVALSVAGAFGGAGW